MAKTNIMLLLLHSKPCKLWTGLEQYIIQSDQAIHLMMINYELYVKSYIKNSIFK